MRCIVSYTIAKRVLFTLQSTFFVTIASSIELRYCLYEAVGSGSKCAKSGLYTVVFIEIIILDAVLIWLNGVSSKVDCVVESRFGTFYFLTLPRPKDNISALSETGYACR